MTIQKARQAIRAGLIVGVPTDTVYGLAADPGNQAAVQSLFRLKGRGQNLPIAVLAASIEQLDQLVAWTGTSRQIVEPHWPGPLTAVLGARAPLVEGLGDPERGTLAVRIPDQDLLLELLGRTGPLAVTSANPSGAPPALDATQAQALFGKRVSVYLEGPQKGDQASTVVDLTRLPPVVLRKGPISPADLAPEI
ncbi:MAG: L-threonylcarbamoyladenylate synthase [bacterium]|nr:L-threonylcarbamoyladenylate synthase [bacterium]MCY3580407.1 L-threonylcarbamoyladenylate synthase [bacterium]MCY3651919.1 L-threonylcarbamoyladenylate synthase [bacterium]MXX64973.1 threonylcarbamoyl-AMP synthase [Acidimicrobiia bacterium]MYH55150.1 threonylcarbamoyl-AMP synthase [Acidimicrobiia bacterium]